MRREEYLVAVGGGLYRLRADSEHDASGRVLGFLGGRGSVAAHEVTRVVSFDDTGSPVVVDVPPLTSYRLAPERKARERHPPRASKKRTAPPPRPQPLAAFVAAVRATVQQLEAHDTRPDYLHGRYFISDVFAARDWGLDLQAFKQRLLEARRAALLTLSRGDLIAALPPEKVRGSLVEDGDRQFHYVESYEGSG